MDEDGFYIGELNGVRGLVPSNFLTDAPPSSLLPPNMPPGSLQQPPLSAVEALRTKGVVFSEVANKKPLPVRQSSQTSNKMASLIAAMGTTSSSGPPPQMGNSVAKVPKSGAAPAGGGAGRPLAKKGSDISTKGGAGNAPRKTSQAAKKSEGPKVKNRSKGMQS